MAGELKMRYVTPYFYNDFKCTADKCPSTCCSGWQISIDEDTLEIYSKEKGALGNRLKKSVDWKEGFFYQNNGRCTMLNDNNLCDLVIAKGDKFLCDTCNTYPRHIEEFEGVREFSLSLSCPVAAGLILNRTDKLVFKVEEDDMNDPLEAEFEEFDSVMYTQLLQVREYLFGIIQNRVISVDLRMSYIMDIAKKLQTAVDEQREICSVINNTNIVSLGDRYEKTKSAYEIFIELEVLREDWSQVIEELKKNLYDITSEEYYDIRKEFYNDFVAELSPEKWEIFKEQLLMFWVYTYFCGAVYDDCVYSKLALAIFSVCFIEEIIVSRWLGNGKRMTMEECIEICYRYAREIEHSDENLNILEEIFDGK